jgi:hypothetical protein
MTPEHSPDTRIIDALGGSGATAVLCDVSSQAVSQWRRSGIPKARRMYLQIVRPEVFESRHETPDDPTDDGRAVATADGSSSGTARP